MNDDTKSKNMIFTYDYARLLSFNLCICCISSKDVLEVESFILKVKFPTDTASLKPLKQFKD